MSAVPTSRPWAALFGLVAGVAACLLAATVASAADRIYWASFSSPPGVAFSNLDGSGGAVLSTAGSSVKEPLGTAIDQVGGRIYWADHTAGKISYANLDGSGGGDLNTTGATTAGPIGVSIDPRTRRIYWANESAGISFANLDGSGGADLNTTGATIKSPAGIAVYPAAGRVYWSNFQGDSLAYANLDGSGGGNLVITGSATVKYPLGVAIDPLAGRIYWANDNPPYDISYANLDGSASANLNTAGATIIGPYGVAIDPVAGRVYWGSTGNAKVSYANLDGSGGADLPIDPAISKGAPNFPSLLLAPRSTGAPAIAGGPKIGSPLACGQGTWADDLPSAFLTRAPLGFSYGWSRDGAPAVPGASSFVPTAVGVYRCTVSASNLAGATSQTSAAVGVYKLGKVKRNKRKGTALLTVTVPSSGTLTLVGRGVVRRNRIVPRAGAVKVLVKAKGKKSKGLKRRGKAKVRLTLTFAPTGAEPGSQVRTIALRRKLQ